MPCVLGAGRGGDADDLETRTVNRHRTGDRSPGVLLRCRARRDDAQLVHHGRAEDVPLRSFQDHAIVRTANHSQLASVLHRCGHAKVVLSTPLEKSL